MRFHLTSLSAGASLFALAAAQDGATAVMTTITLTPEADILFQGLTFTGTATLWSGKTVFFQSTTMWWADESGSLGYLDGGGIMIVDALTISEGQFMTNGVAVPVVATQGAVPAASATPISNPTTMSYGLGMTMSTAASGVPAGSAKPGATSTSGTALPPAETSSIPATLSAPIRSMGERVTLGRVVAAVSVFIAALGTL